MQAQSVEDLRKLRAGSLHNNAHGFGTGMLAKGAAMFPQYSAPSHYGKNQQNPLYVPHSNVPMSTDHFTLRIGLR